MKSTDRAANCYILHPETSIQPEEIMKTKAESASLLKTGDPQLDKFISR